MKTTKSEQDKFKRILRDAYFSKELSEIKEGWQHTLITQVMESKHVVQEPHFIPTLGQFVWRLAPATLALNVGLVILLALLHLTTQYNGLQLLVNNLQLLALEQVFGT